MTKKRDKSRVANGSFCDPMAVTWTEKYDKQISAVWNRVPESIAKLLATLAVFVLGVSINGEWKR